MPSTVSPVSILTRPPLLGEDHTATFIVLSKRTGTLNSSFISTAFARLQLTFFSSRPRRAQVACRRADERERVDGEQKEGDAVPEKVAGGKGKAPVQQPKRGKRAQEDWEKADVEEVVFPAVHEEEERKEERHGQERGHQGSLEPYLFAGMGQVEECDIGSVPLSHFVTQKPRPAGEAPSLSSWRWASRSRRSRP